MLDASPSADAAMRPFQQSLPMALLRAREATMRFFRPALNDRHLTEQQWRVLRALNAADGPLEVGEVADHTFLLAPSLSRIVANLEERELVRRAPVPRDQRRAHLSLSTSGRRLVRQIAPVSEARYEEIERQFGTERLHELLSLLDELSQIDADLPDPLTHEREHP